MERTAKLKEDMALVGMEWNVDSRLVIGSNMEIFDPKNIKKLNFFRERNWNKSTSQVTIIGGSSLFHGAPLLALKVASRISGMVYFASPSPSVGKAAELIKSKLLSFIWIPWKEVEEYVNKSDAVLIGPGFMRFRSEKLSETQRIECDQACRLTREITQGLISKFPKKKWVIDAGSLQSIEKKWIPENSILTPNIKEYRNLFENKKPEIISRKYNCVILYKQNPTVVCSPKKCVEVGGGNGGMAKGGMGDVLSGLVLSLYAGNDPFLAATSASFLSKYAADKLYQEKGSFYNADDLADKISSVALDFVK